jgi:hypothetical protein
LEEEGQWGDHEIDGKIYRGIQPTCSGFRTGRLQQDIRSRGTRLAQKRAEAPYEKKKIRDHFGMHFLPKFT